MIVLKHKYQLERKPMATQLGEAPGSGPGNPVTAPPLLFVGDLRRLLPGLGRDAVYGLLRSGEIPSRLIAGKYVTTQAALQDWIDEITNGHM